MRNEEGRWDPATVLGLRSDQNVLVVGNAAFMHWLTSENERITSSRKLGELAQFAVEHDYDLVIIGRETEFSRDHLSVAEQALRNRGGLLAYFPRSEAEAWAFQQQVEFYHPEAQVWDLDTTFGRVIFTNLSGRSWRDIIN